MLALQVMRPLKFNHAHTSLSAGAFSAAFSIRLPLFDRPEKKMLITGGFDHAIGLWNIHDTVGIVGLLWAFLHPFPLVLHPLF